MDDSNLSAYDQFWGNLAVDPNVPPSSFDGSWEPFGTSNNGSASLRSRADFPFSSSSYTNNHRTSQHRRRNRRSPSYPTNTNSSSANQPHRTTHESIPHNLPEPHNPQTPDTPNFEVNQYSQPPFHQQSRLDQYIQLPGINTAFPDLNFTDRPPSRFSWDSAGGDSLFADSDFWPDFGNSNSNSIIDNNGFVDLTTDSSPPHTMPVSRKRRTSATSRPAPLSPPSQSSKRQKTNHAGIKTEEAKVEHLDLLDIDDDTGLSHVLEQQQAAVIKEQQGRYGDEPTRLSTLQCIICMEPMTNMTVTHCGEFSLLLHVYVLAMIMIPDRHSCLHRPPLLPHLYNGSLDSRGEPRRARQSHVKVSCLPQKGFEAKRKE